MPKNLLIFSDLTGQAEGLRPDENRSNIYKFDWAARCGPDTTIDHREQLAFFIVISPQRQHAGVRPPAGSVRSTFSYARS